MLTKVPLKDVIAKLYKEHESLVTQRSVLSVMVVDLLVEKYGSLNKAAFAVGEHPGNFVNTRKGKRQISWDKLLEFSQYLS